MAKGVDILGYEWAKDNSKAIIEFPADWSLGRAAGMIRNNQMAKYADAAIVIHNNTPGSINMINQMKKLGKPVYEFTPNSQLETEL